MNRGIGWVMAVVAVLVGTAAAQQTGTFTDSRDGQKYKTVKIGNQTWMAENLRFKIGDSWCYENSADSCAKYGRLYDWHMTKFACPKGWHLPSKGEWTELVTVVGSSTAGKKLRSKSGWNNMKDGSSGNGTDDYGFSALPGGGRDSGGDFYYVGTFGSWWTATEGKSGYAYSRSMYYYDDYVNEGDDGKDYGFSVRCVQ